MKWPIRNPHQAYYGNGMGVTKLLHKSNLPTGRLGQCTSDQAGEPRNEHELLSSFIIVHSRPFAVQ